LNRPTSFQPGQGSELTPLVSVLMTAYNCEKFITQAIKSVIQNVYQNWELIIVDDCSTDRSFEIVTALQKEDSRIKIFRNQDNLGDYPNRNKAASLAQGKYIKYVDADDMIYPYGLEIMVRTMEQYPEAALGISQEVEEDFDPYPFLLNPEECYRRQFIKKGVLDLGPTGTIIRRDAFLSAGGFSGARHIGDVELWLKLAARQPVVKIQPGLVFWRRHPGQEIETELKNPKIYAIRFNHAISTLHQEGCPLPEADILLAERKIKKRHARLILHFLFRKGNLKKSFVILKDSDFNLADLFYAWVSS
jgi:glycosyltransferase involved in cell wall biosynthesis